MKKGLKAVSLLGMLGVLFFGLFACEERINESLVYTITFDSMGGTAVDATLIDENSLITEPEVTKEGHTLIGWYQSDDEGTTFDEVWSFSTDKVFSSMTLYAQWEINQYTVTFMDDDSVLHEETVDFDAPITAFEAPTKEGHTFSDWDLEIPTHMPAEDLVFRAQWAINQYTVTFMDDDTVLHEETVDFDAPIAALEAPTKEGYTFSGWDLEIPTHMPAEDLVFRAQWDVKAYTLTLVDAAQTVLYEAALDYGTNLQSFSPPDALREGYQLIGWQHLLPETMPAVDLQIEAMWMPIFTMVQVGEKDTDYTVPFELDDSDTTTVTGGYEMATTPTTYLLWYEVRVWAEANGYHFENEGREGSHGAIGEAPTEAKHEPVTNVSWYDTIVWLNALSEMHGLSPVYRDAEEAVIRDSREANHSVVNQAIEGPYDGYRLPTIYEWNMAARWQEEETKTETAILVGGRYWTPGNYASGAQGPAWNHDDWGVGDEAATRAVAWFVGAEGGDFTRAVGLLEPNDLGLYDMSGNVWEWSTTRHLNIQRMLGGGSWLQIILMTQVGYLGPTHPANAFDYYGFRIAK